MSSTKSTAHRCIFYRALQLLPFDNKLGGALICCDSGTFPAATPHSNKGQYAQYSPSLFLRASVVNAPL